MTDHNAGRGRRVGVPAAAGVLLLLAAMSVGGSRLDWPAIGHWLRAHALIIVLATTGVVLLLVAALELWRHRERDRGRRAPLSWWAIAAGTALVLATTWGATTWLLHEAAHAQDPAAARVDAVKTGLGIGAGTAGILALLVAVRRQWHQELTALDTTHDATERRVTDLYTKAVEQLGSDKAPVRLGGLYALERLAQDNSTQRKTIINVWCAYLRMPYTPPEDDPPGPETDEKTLQDYQERAQESQVRLTAQNLIGRHLRPGKDPNAPLPTFWADIHIDLTGATLIGYANFRKCIVLAGEFDSATFTDHANFYGITFTAYASFKHTNFRGKANFRRATFPEYADFTGAMFTDDTHFQNAVFADEVPKELKPFWAPSENQTDNADKR